MFEWVLPGEIGQHLCGRIDMNQERALANSTAAWGGIMAASIGVGVGLVGWLYIYVGKMGYHCRHVCVKKRWHKVELSYTYVKSCFEFVKAVLSL